MKIKLENEQIEKEELEKCKWDYREALETQERETEDRIKEIKSLAEKETENQISESKQILLD